VLVAHSHCAPAYLRRDLIVDPVVRNWYAWAFTVAPAPAAHMVVNSHLPMLESYLADPESHIAAAEDPDLAGGPFVNVPVEQAERVEDLYQQTKRDAADLAAFVGAMEQASALLQLDARGGPMAPLYERLPAPLRGRVELTYGLDHSPRMRLIEPMLYRSSLSARDRQAIILRPRLNGGRRPFILSTPRFRNASDVVLDGPFDDGRVDRIFTSMVEARPRRELLALLGLRGDDERADLYVTDLPPRPRALVESAATLAARYFGHACLLFEWRGRTVMTDPLLAPASGSRFQGLTIEDVPPRLDVVLLTHAHQDHLVLETLLAIRNRVGTVVVPRAGAGDLQDPNLRLLLQHCGFRNVVELDEFETLSLDGLEVTAVPLFGEHGDLAIRAKSAYVVAAGGSSAMVGADSACLDAALYRHVNDAVGSVDTLFIGMECIGAPLSWGYGPLFPAALPRQLNDQRRTSGCDGFQASEIARAIGAARVYVYAMAQEPWAWHLLAPDTDARSPRLVEVATFVAAARRRGLDAEFLVEGARLALGGSPLRRPA
jgi:L-ascorbate metabolism protein UlaG (beta-lactamase superfamily)